MLRSPHLGLHNRIFTSRSIHLAWPETRQCHYLRDTQGNEYWECPTAHGRNPEHYCIPAGGWESHAVSQADNSINPKEINEMLLSVIMANDKNSASPLTALLTSLLSLVVFQPHHLTFLHHVTPDSWWVPNSMHCHPHHHLHHLHHFVAIAIFLTDGEFLRPPLFWMAQQFFAMQGKLWRPWVNTSLS